MEVNVLNGSIQDKRALERSTADNVSLKANLDYVAMMTNVDIPVETEVDSNVVSEN